MKKAAKLLALFILIMILAACARQADTSEDVLAQDEVNGAALHDYADQSDLADEYGENGGEASEAIQVEQLRTEAERDENLVKLGKVWGFVKYTHNSFITGEKCWDEELLRLVPIVYNAHPSKVNGILYDWFISLGDDGYDFEFGHDFDFVTYLELWENDLVFLENFFEQIMGVPVDAIAIENREIYEFFAALADDGYDLDWQSFEMLLSENFPDSQAVIRLRPESRPVADLSWINYEYLGALAVHLLRFDGIAVMDRLAAPASFDPRTGNAVFYNQSHHQGMDFSDVSYRLLGLFRLWNAMKYYYPHLGILDVEWNDLLSVYITKMLDGEDRFSYELTLAMLSHHVRDSTHLFLSGTTFFEDSFGRFLAPMRIREAEGRLVVYCGDDMQHPNPGLRHLTLPNPFERGDVILGVGGRDIDEITAEMLRVLPYPNEEKALAFLAKHAPLRTRRAGNMEIVVLRDDVELTIEVHTINPGQAAMMSHPTYSHVLLDNNIGLINPQEPFDGKARHVMEEFADTDGIIIDLRQYPDWIFYLEMRQYLMEESLPFAYVSTPSQTHPGARVDVLTNQYHPRSPYAFIYDRPVVLLMDEWTASRPEWMIMAYRVAPNVTVMGPWSMGANGEITFLPLPGGITMMFTGMGIYTPDGGQTHRIGLEPDIRVDRTIQGIAEGRDEIMEAAIEFILGS